MEKNFLLGISCFYHDSAAALVSDNGEILAAAQEERFSRKKNDSRFPFCALDYCLKVSKEKGVKVSAYVYYEKPVRVFMRLLETYFTTAPRGISSFLPVIRNWITDKLFTKQKLIENISLIDSDFNKDCLFFSEHHFSHASSAFYPSPFADSAILCMDAVGEWATTSAWMGEKNLIRPIWEIEFPHSIGMLYSAFTYYCGFKVNSGEYKLMGLAPYGDPIYKSLILKNLIFLKEDGSFSLNMKYFKFHRGFSMISKDFIKLFGKLPRSEDQEITQFYMNVAASVQCITELIVLKMVRNLQLITKSKKLCLAGGVALNCVINGKIIDETGFEEIWIQPASGDSGNALGSALAYIYNANEVERIVKKDDSMNSSYLGPDFTDESIKNYLDSLSVKYKYFSNDNLCLQTAKYLADGKIVGWFQGRMEYGPRALGNRSILGDPRIENMQKKMNLKIKHRESFRPFAPAVLDKYKDEYFGLNVESPYMLITKKINSCYLVKKESGIPTKKSVGFSKLEEVRSIIPAVTHVDNSCRVQTVSKNRNAIFNQLIESFYSLTGCPALINTSFNIRGEPIVCSPEDALRCFLFSDFDLLVINNYMIKKNDVSKVLIDKFERQVVTDD